MSASQMKPIRSWQEIAERVLQEEDHEKALKLAEELIAALDAQTRRPMDRLEEEQKTRSAGRSGTR